MIGLLLLMALECPATITGSVEIYAKAYYLHENPPGLRYVYTTDVEIYTNTTVYVHAQGLPVAIEWYSRPYGGISKAEVEFELGKTCGEVPDPVFPFIFSDGFESGTTDAWSEVYNPPPATPTPTPTPIPTMTPVPTPTPTPIPPSSLIFEDGFESGDLEAWNE